MPSDGKLQLQLREALISLGLEVSIRRSRLFCLRCILENDFKLDVDLFPNYAPQFG